MTEISSRMRSLFALTLLSSAIACRRATTSHASGSTSSSANGANGANGVNGGNGASGGARIAHATDHSVASAGAFDLVTTEGGAALVWAPVGSRTLALTLLDEWGTERRSEPVVASSEDAGAPPQGAMVGSIGEVAAAARGNELAVAWLEQNGDSARTRGLIRPISASASAPAVIEIGPVLLPLSTPRGNLALTSSQDRFLLLSRGQKSDCVEPTEHDCVGFGFHRLDRTSAAAQSLPLTVPLPCEQNSVSFAVAGSRWYYGVCSRATGKPITTLFSIQPDPAYARADRILEGCLPLGALAQGGDLLVVGDCSGERRGVRVRGGSLDVVEVRVDRLDAVCDAGRPLIHQLGPNGLRLSLEQPRDRLEAFLPSPLNADAARAVWTGQTLLVAASKHGTITLKGYRCDSTLLREVSLGPQSPR